VHPEQYTFSLRFDTYNAGTRGKVFIHDIAKDVLDTCNQVSLLDGGVYTWIDFKNTSCSSVNLYKGHAVNKIR
jgi:hypothetical protein